MRTLAFSLLLLVGFETIAGMPPARNFVLTAARPPVASGGATTLFTDDYNRADTSAMGANYTESVSWDYAIVSNKLRQGLGGAAPAILITTTTAHADTADVSVSITHSTTGADGGPIARCTDNDTAPTMYAFDVFSGSCELHRYNNSASATTLGTASITLTANGVAKLVVSGTGATVTLNCYYNGVLVIGPISDTSGSRITTAGRTGVHSWTSGGTTDRDWDDLLVTTP